MTQQAQGLRTTEDQELRDAAWYYALEQTGGDTRWRNIGPIFEKKLDELIVSQRQAANPGGYTVDTSRYAGMHDRDFEKLGTTVALEQFERYMTDFAPQEKRLLSSLDNTTAEAAAKSSKKDAERARSALDRMRSRYGTSMTSHQKQAESNQHQRTTTLGGLSATNSARQMDEDRRFNLQGTMLNIGNNLSSTAMSGLTDASTNASARQQQAAANRAQHDAARHQQRAGMIQAGASLAALAFM